MKHIARGNAICVCLIERIQKQTPAAGTSDDVM